MDSRSLGAAIASSALVLAYLAWTRKHKQLPESDPWKNDKNAIRREDLPDDGRELFCSWLHEAEKREGFSARVMVVATCTIEDGPTARSVVCHKINHDGSIVFGTNSMSQKACALRGDPRCELLFRWGDRQIRIRGLARMGDSSETDAVFARLPRHCQLGLQCLNQGNHIDEEDHKSSIAGYAAQLDKFGLDANRGPSIPRPANYTAVVIRPSTFDFYQGGQTGYINDRFLFSRSGDSGATFPLVGRLQA